MVDSAGVVGPTGPSAENRKPGGRVQSGILVATAVATFVAGVWLIIAPFVLGHWVRTVHFAGFWNDLLVGNAIALLALVRSAVARQMVWSAYFKIVLGGWLLAAPAALGYNASVESPNATLNDRVVGVIVVFLAAITVTVVRHRRRVGKAT